MTTSHSLPPAISRSVLKYRDYRLFLFARLLSTAAIQIQSVAVGYQVYEISHDTLALGFVGLAQFLPMLALILPAGDLADRGCVHLGWPPPPVDVGVGVGRDHQFLDGILAVNRDFDRVGAKHNAQTSEEDTFYHVTCLPEYLQQAFDVLSDILRPTLRTVDFETEMVIVAAMETQGCVSRVSLRSITRTNDKASVDILEEPPAANCRCFVSSRPIHVVKVQKMSGEITFTTARGEMPCGS